MKQDARREQEPSYKVWKSEDRAKAIKWYRPAPSGKATSEMSNHRFYEAISLTLKTNRDSYIKLLNEHTKSSHGPMLPTITTIGFNAIISQSAHNVIWPWTDQSPWITMRWCHFPPITSGPIPTHGRVTRKDQSQITFEVVGKVKPLLGTDSDSQGSGLI